jgi:hypothetical protein
MKRVSLALITVVAMLNVLVTSAHGQQPPSGSRPEVLAAAFTAEVTGTVTSVNE